MESLWVYLTSGIVLGVLGALIMDWLSKKGQLLAAEHTASDLVQAAEEKVKAADQALSDKMEEHEENLWNQFEQESRKSVQANKNLEERIEDLEIQFKEKIQTLEKQRERAEQIFKSREGRHRSKEGQIRQIFETESRLLAQVREGLVATSQTNIDEVKAEIITRLEHETRQQAAKLVQEMEQEATINLERDARRVIQLAIARFPRPYCPERGIGNVNFPSPEAKDNVLGRDRQWLKALERACGVDISINEEYQSASILGFDPVRRELGRMSLEKMLHDKNLSEKRIETIVQSCKKDLFRKIIQDGNRIARELKIEGLSEEVRHMMGALRYRYSFAQNQHFHCAEVGFLCGLLSAELGVNIKDGRRSGLLHDIGKAMDHSKDGGHAVIGADFIEKNGEKPHIVHAVRAHHHDEPPSTDLAYLVIAADAISGARPGARRSTVESYTQKIADLEKIGSSFRGVVATYILSAGREVRVIVDSDQVSDYESLELSKKIARKIEDELSYPGLIKLTVVRETQAIEMAR